MPVNHKTELKMSSNKGFKDNCETNKFKKIKWFLSSNREIRTISRLSNFI